MEKHFLENLLIQFKVSFFQVKESLTYSLTIAFTFKLHFVSQKDHQIYWIFKFIFAFVWSFADAIIQVFLFDDLRSSSLLTSTLFIVNQGASSFVVFIKISISFFISNDLNLISFYRILQINLSIFFCIQFTINATFDQSSQLTNSADFFLYPAIQVIESFPLLTLSHIIPIFFIFLSSNFPFFEQHFIFFEIINHSILIAYFEMLNIVHSFLFISSLIILDFTKFSNLSELNPFSLLLQLILNLIEFRKII